MALAVNPYRPAPGAPRPYHFPHFTRHRLSNGLQVWLVPLPGRDMASVHLLVDAAASAEDAAQAGIASLTAQVLVTGTRRLDAAAFAEATEQLGIEVSSESSWDSARAAFGSIATQLIPGLRLLAEMVREPRFDAAEFDRLRAERLNEFLQGRADPRALADEMYVQQLYADGVPYGRLAAGMRGTVEALSVDDARAFHARHWGSDTAHLIVAGGFDSDAVLAEAERLFGNWPAADGGHRPVTPEPRGGRRVVLVERPGSVQSELRVGQIGIDRYDPDFFPALVMAAMLGGVFHSRLNRRLREELGYTYGARAGFDPRRAAGPFTAHTAVHTEVTRNSIVELLAQLDALRAKPPDDAELRGVKDYLIGVFPLRFESTGGIAAAMEPLAVYGLPGDWWETYRERIEAVTPDDAHAAAQRLLDPEALLILLVADAAAVRGDLEDAAFGPLEVVDPATVA
jgi:zinc protease